jgi:hypothetical protein
VSPLAPWAQEIVDRCNAEGSKGSGVCGSRRVVADLLAGMAGGLLVLAVLVLLGWAAFT